MVEILKTITPAVISVIVPLLGIIMLIGYTVYSFRVGEYSKRLNYELDTQEKIYTRYGLYYSLPKILIALFFIVLLYLLKVYPWLYKNPATIGSIYRTLLTLFCINFPIFLLALFILGVLSNEPNKIIRWKHAILGKCMRRRTFRRRFLYLILYAYFAFGTLVIVFIFHRQYILGLSVKITPTIVSFVLLIWFVVIIEVSLLSRTHVYEIVFQESHDGEIIREIKGYFVCRFRNGDFLIRHLREGLPEAFEVIANPSQETRIMLTDVRNYEDIYYEHMESLLQEAGDSPNHKS